MCVSVPSCAEAPRCPARVLDSEMTFAMTGEESTGPAHPDDEDDPAGGNRARR